MASGTVTYVDGPVIGLNTDGSKETEGPHKGNLKTTYTVKTKKDHTVVEIDGVSLNKRVADILAGDTIVTSGRDDDIHRIKVSRPAAVQQKLDASGFGPVNPAVAPKKGPFHDTRPTISEGQPIPRG